jgi:uncharacterized protein (DUF924 family)
MLLFRSGKSFLRLTHSPPIDRSFWSSSLAVELPMLIVGGHEMILFQMSDNHRPEDILNFWFPPQSRSTDPAIVAQQVEWWFRGGSDSDIIGRFEPVLAAAERGDLDHWSRSAGSRLALIIVLDQFSRSIHRGSARAYANDPKAISLTLGGLENGHVTALQPPWEMLFFGVPLGHSEDMGHQDLSVQLMDRLVEMSSPELRWIMEYSAETAREHRDVIRLFGRHPHRNELLGRQSTADELAYLAKSEFAHTRPIRRPQHLPDNPKPKE